MEFITITDTNLFEILIYFLKGILEPLTALFQRMGIIKSSFG